MELGTKQRVLMESNSLNRFVDVLPAKIQVVQGNQQVAVTSKYNHLVSSIKPIHRLMSKYRDKIQKFISELESNYKIEQISRQIWLYSERAKEMEELNRELDQQIETETKASESVRENVAQSRRRLNALKLNNAELSYNIEVEERRIDETNKVAKKKTGRIQLVPSQTAAEKGYRLLQEQYFQSQKTLFSQVHQKVMLNKLLTDCFRQVRDTLKEDQKKSHKHGLAGSLLFKLALPQKENKPRQEYKMGNDMRSLVYDTLKAKFKAHKKQQSKVQVCVDLKRFSNFSQLQTVGCLSLRPESFRVLESAVEARMREILLRYSLLT